jgi:zinc resistance-associated protein
MLKKFAIGAATLAVFGTTVALAQQARERPDGPRPPAISREDATAFLEARIAALHSGLLLTPAQEPLWPAFEQAYRERAKLRMERAFAGNAAPRTDDPIERLQRRAEVMIRQGAVLKALADAAAPLWRSFDDGQKRRFAILARPRSATAGFGDGRPDDRSAAGGPPGRDGNRDGFGQPQRGFAPGGPGRRDGDEYGDGRGSGRSGPGSGPDRFGPGRRGGDDYGDGRNSGGFGPNGPTGRDGGESGRGMGPGGPPSRGGERFGFGRDPGGIGPGAPQGRDRESGPDRDQRRMMPRRPDRDYGRDFHRDFGREDYGRGQFRWWHRPGDGSGRGGWRDSRDPDDRDFRGEGPGESGGPDEHFSRGDDERL